ncbi:helix-turn-helix domain-containing protein [Streptomyces sp. BE20]|uniref:helix-turn-helix domain-containing protein n=1 Tax=unclassified Streptomyces TaxID=2593676 RepID=UPI002E78227D|nr:MULTISPECIES: helix-turn-helix domain-containing protein [unclassified Streptomyces]MED7948841.1 helix-turn-helix domain-containing protein [Streptomyces sp. BE303]MEE1821330.1 helix-turn-helix domain-containing protein [Streptomyces sp. BE20]
MPLNSEHIGARVRIARNAAGLTQVELADFLGRAESWVANVESGRMVLDRYSVITAIAEQCDVDVVWLLGQPYRLQRAGGTLAHVPAIRTGIRRASLILSGHPGLIPQGAPVELAELRKQSRRANAARQAANLPHVATLLPPLIEDLNTAVLTLAGTQRSEALRLLVDAARTARMCLNQLGYPDLAWSAAEVAAGAATAVDDPLMRAAVAWDRCGALLHQASNRETIAVAEAAMRDLEPHARSGPGEQAAVSLRGALHLRCSIAHARAGQREDAWARIDAALEDANRLGPGWYDLANHTVFGRGVVAVHAAEAGVEVDQPDRGLQRVPQVDITEVPSMERRTHYAIDQARAMYRMGRAAAAVVKLKEAATAAPHYVYADPMSRALVTELVQLGVPSQAVALSGLIHNMELVQ